MDFTDNYKEAKFAYRLLKSGKITEAEKIFLRFTAEENRYCLIGYIGLAAAETARSEYDEGKIVRCLAKAVEKESCAEEMTRRERAYMKRLVNNSSFPEYRLPLIYFAEENNISGAEKMLTSLGADRY